MSDPILEVDRKVTRRYDIGQKLGKGAYGVVWKATERHSGQVVALKKIFDAFQNATDAQRTYREIIFLQQMGTHENIIRLDEVVRADNDRDIYLVFEFMETDLHAAIRANILEDVHKQYIMYQSFKALMYMHSAQLVHRDMKPANLLLNAECLMKVADFGLARSLVVDDHVAEGICTDYVATRWYRAPEILVASQKYGTPVDLWSLGCIFAEMLGGEPTFTGKTTLNQIEKIVDHLGMPTEEDKHALQSVYTESLISSCFADEPTPQSATPARSTPRVPPPARCNKEVLALWRQRYQRASDEAIDLLALLLVLNPNKRMAAESLLTHPYCAAFHDASAASQKAKSSITVHDVNDDTKQPTNVYRDKLYKIIESDYNKKSRSTGPPISRRP